MFLVPLLRFLWSQKNKKLYLILQKKIKLRNTSLSTLLSRLRYRSKRSRNINSWINLRTLRTLIKPWLASIWSLKS